MTGGADLCGNCGHKRCVHPSAETPDGCCECQGFVPSIRSPLEVEAERLAELAVGCFGMPRKVCYCQADELKGTGESCPRCQVKTAALTALRSAQARGIRIAAAEVDANGDEDCARELRALADEKEKG